MVANKKVVLIVLALACATPLFFLGGPNWHSPDVYRAAWNQGHTVFFFLASWLLAQKLPLRQYWWQYLGGLLVLSLAIETTQAQIGRSFSLLDITNNLLGAGFYLVWAQPVWQRIIVMLPLLWQWGDIGLHGLAYLQQVQRFPVLANFETPGQMRQWRGPIARLETDSGFVGQISFTTDTFSTVMLDDMPRDWRTYQTLSFTANNPSDFPLPVVLRINDIQHIYVDQEDSDRYRQRLVIEPGTSTVQVNLAKVANAPQDRAMDMNEIQALMLFSTSLPEPRQLLIDNMKLVKP